MTHEEAFIASIIESPEDDVPRLIFADFLQEQEQPERAHFIRTQCELAKCGPPHKQPTNLASFSFFRLEGMVLGCLPKGECLSIADRIDLILPAKERQRYKDGKANWFGMLVTDTFCTSTRTNEWSITFRMDEHSRLWTGTELAKTEMHMITEWGIDVLAGFAVEQQIKPTFCRGFIECVECKAEWFISHGDEMLKWLPLRKVTLTTLPNVQLRVYDGSGPLAFIEGLKEEYQPHHEAVEDMARELLRRNFPRIKEWKFPA